MSQQVVPLLTVNRTHLGPEWVVRNPNPQTENFT